jgi:hypothetical protein
VILTNLTKDWAFLGTGLEVTSKYGKMGKRVYMMYRCKNKLKEG